ncbi:hypothetical protein CR513_28774, partial [Mucuna pruriens]
MARVSKILLKFMIFAAMVIVLIFSIGVSSKQDCNHGTCAEFPNCDAHCKGLGFKKGTCMPPLIKYLCCCSD